MAAPNLATQNPPLSAPPRAWIRRLALGLRAPAVFLALALAGLRPGLVGHDTIVGNTGDPSLFIWSLQWVPFALSHGLNPLVTDYLHYPSGANLMWNSTILFPALVLTPVTELFGPIVSYNVLAVLAMSLSGWCAYVATGRYSRRWTSALIAGLLYEFSPFMATQITGHAQLFVAVFPPLLLLFGDEILLRQRRPAALMGALLGFAAAAQLLTGSEMLAISLILAIPAVATLAVIDRAQLRERLPHAVRAAEYAVVTFAVLAAYPLYIQFLGPDRIYGVLEGFGYVARPTSFVIPSSAELISGPSTIFDSSVYIGVPLLILAIAVVVWMRRRPALVVAGVTLASTMVLALGGHLTIHGAATRIPLPWLVAQHLPVLADLLPTRLMVVGYLALGVIVAVFVDRVLEAPWRWRLAGLASVGVALVFLIPTMPIDSGQYVIPAFFTDGGTRGLPQTGSVLMTPYGNTPYIDDLPQVWQAEAGMDFRTQLGMLYAAGPGGRPTGEQMDPLGEELHDLGDLDRPAPATLTASERATCLADMRAHDVTSVIAGPSPGQAQVVQFMTELLGTPGTSTGGVVVWYGVGALTP